MIINVDDDDKDHTDDDDDENRVDADADNDIFQTMRRIYMLDFGLARQYTNANGEVKQHHHHYSHDHHTIITTIIKKMITIMIWRCVLPAQLRGSEAPSDTLPSMLTRIKRWVSLFTFRWWRWWFWRWKLRLQSGRTARRPVVAVLHVGWVCQWATAMEEDQG